MSNDERYVIEGRKAYGVGLTEANAMFNFINYWHGDCLDEEEIVMWHVTGYSGGAHYRIDAEEVHSEEWFRIQKDDFKRLLKLTEGFYEYDGILCDAEKFDPRD